MNRAHERYTLEGVENCPTRCSISAFPSNLSIPLFDAMGESVQFERFEGHAHHEFCAAAAASLASPSSFLRKSGISPTGQLHQLHVAPRFPL
jgi:hypothetical protein